MNGFRWRCRFGVDVVGAERAKLVGANGADRRKCTVESKIKISMGI